MAQYITKIKTSDGDKQIDYNALANKPEHTLEALGVTVTADEINKLDGVDTNIKEQLDNMVSKSGDTMTGNLVVFTAAAAVTLKAPDDADGQQALARVYKNANASVDYGLQLRDYARGNITKNSSTIIMICDARGFSEKVQLVHQVDGANKYYKLYGEHNKPTLEDLGATVTTTDLTEGVSALETGKLYFVYE